MLLPKPAAGAVPEGVSKEESILEFSSFHLPSLHVTVRIFIISYNSVRLVQQINTNM
jgi:hypothetical protein